MELEDMITYTENCCAENKRMESYSRTVEDIYLKNSNKTLN